MVAKKFKLDRVPINKWPKLPPMRTHPVLKNLLLLDSAKSGVSQTRIVQEAIAEKYGLVIDWVTGELTQKDGSKEVGLIEVDEVEQHPE